MIKLFPYCAFKEKYRDKVIQIKPVVIMENYTIQLIIKMSNCLVINELIHGIHDLFVY